MKLVLLPGLDGTGRLFDPFIKALPDRIETKVVSYPTEQEMDYSELCDFVLSRLPREQDYVLVGESFSSPIAIEICARRPGCLSGLVLVCGFASNPIKAASSLAPLIDYLPTRGHIVRAISTHLLGATAPDNRRRLIEAVEAVDSTVLRNRLKMIVSLDVSDALGKIGVPALYLRASNDKLVGRGSATEIQQAIASLELETLDGPHFLLQERAVESARVISEFVSRVLE